MNRNKLFTAICLPALLLAAGGCTQDEIPGDGNTLPEGQYPLQIASVSLSAEITDEPWGASEAPQTRVAESADGGSSHWTDGDVIGVKIGEDGTPGEYTMNVDENGNVTVTAIDAAYWTSTVQAAVSAWYPTTETVSLADQSDKLAYVLQGSGTGTYNAAVTLNFTHSLAKVRVIVEGTKAAQVDEVKIWSYPTCTYMQGGNVQGLGQKQYITMFHKENSVVWEANVVAESLSTDDCNKYVQLVMKSGNLESVSISLNTNTLAAGTINEIRINANGYPITIDDNGTYEINGVSERLIITGKNPTIIFKDAHITSYADDVSAIRIADGCTPTLKFEGTNLLCKNGGDGSRIGCIMSEGNAEYHIQLENDAKLAVISNAIAIGGTYRDNHLAISGKGTMWLESNGRSRPAIIVNNGKLTISDNVDLTAVVGGSPRWNGNRPFVVAIGDDNYGSYPPGTVSMNNCTLKLYTIAQEGEPQHWVYLVKGSVSPGVDAVLQKAYWDEEVDAGNGVKVTKLKEKPVRPDWVDKLLNQ